MILTHEKPLAEVNAEAIRQLCREIGLVNTLKFINQYTNGLGDYTEERAQLIKDETLDELVKNIKQHKKQ